MPIVIDDFRGIDENGCSAIDESPDPLWFIYMRELTAMVASLEACTKGGWKDSAYDLAESTCESSRALLYKVDYLTVGAAQKLADLFLQAATAIDLIAKRPEAAERQPFLRGFAQHVQSRAKLLEERVKAAKR